jgi:magnesium-transporting ATPase (P-type)
MIQEADVGVGISGREGLQAARAADYSIARFKFLARLLLVHGRYSYNSAAFIAQYCFYKSMFIAFLQLGYSVCSGFAGSSFLGSVSLMTYNTFYTGLPALALVLDKDVPESELMLKPQLYQSCQSGSGINLQSMMEWFYLAVYHCVVVSVLTYNTHSGITGYLLGDNGQAHMALQAFTACVLLQLFLLFTLSNYITNYNLVTVVGTGVLFFVLNFVIDTIPQYENLGVMQVLIVDPVYYLFVLLVICVCIIPVVLRRFIIEYYNPTPSMRARQRVLSNLHSSPGMTSSSSISIPSSNKGNMFADNNESSSTHSPSRGSVGMGMGMGLGTADNSNHSNSPYFKMNDSQLKDAQEMVAMPPLNLEPRHTNFGFNQFSHNSHNSLSSRK